MKTAVHRVLRFMWIVALFLSLAGWALLALFHASSTYVDAQGVVHEPLFGLIPISWFLLLAAIGFAVCDLVCAWRARST